MAATSASLSQCSRSPRRRHHSAALRAACASMSISDLSAAPRSASLIGKLCSLLTRRAILPSIPSTLDPASLYVLFCNPSLSTLLTTFQGPAFHCRLMPLHGPVPIVVLPRSRTAITLHPRSTPYSCASIQPFRSPHKVRLNSNLSTDRLRLPMRHLFPSSLSLPIPYTACAHLHSIPSLLLPFIY